MEGKFLQLYREAIEREERIRLLQVNRRFIRQEEAEAEV